MKELLENKSDLLELCEVKPVESIDFAEITRYDTIVKDNEYLLEKYFRNKVGEMCLFANLFRIEGKTYYQISKELKQDFKCNVKLATYRKLEEQDVFKYRFDHWNIFTQLEELEDYYRSEEAEENRMAELEGLAVISLDFDKYIKLLNIYTKYLKLKVILVFQLEGVGYLLNKAYDYYILGLDCSGVNASINKHLNIINSLLEDKETKEFLLENNELKTDYIIFSDLNVEEVYTKEYESFYGYSEKLELD